MREIKKYFHSCFLICIRTTVMAMIWRSCQLDGKSMKVGIYMLHLTLR